MKEPFISKEYIPSFNNWWENKIQKNDKWNKYLSDLKKYEEFLEKLKSGKIQKFTVNIECVKTDNFQIQAIDEDHAWEVAEEYLDQNYFDDDWQIDSID
jgi:hypothetical protein